MIKCFVYDLNINYENVPLIPHHIKHELLWERLNVKQVESMIQTLEEAMYFNQMLILVTI